MDFTTVDPCNSTSEMRSSVLNVKKLPPLFSVVIVMPLYAIVAQQLSINTSYYDPTQLFLSTKNPPSLTLNDLATPLNPSNISAPSVWYPYATHVDF
ncbi:hypothetical protein GEMRC1_009941 [Eukaryota sp. GEM-RC1]